MAFRTKLDYSDNRQIIQRENTITALSGRTDLGVAFSALTGGPNLASSEILYEITGITSTFSGNLTTTIFNFGAPEMNGGENYLNTITPSNKNDDQIVDEPFFIGINSSVNPYTLQTIYEYYTGSTFDITITNFEEISPSAFTGTLYTELVTVYSASSADYTGDGVWANINGKLKTEEVIITKNPFIGYVLTALDVSGNTAWMPSGIGVDGSPYFISGSSGTYSIKAINGTGIDATGNNAFAVGSNTLASGLNSVASGSFTQATAINSHAEGSATQADGAHSHAEGHLTQANGLASHAEGHSTTADGDYSHAEGENTQAIGDYSHVEGQFSSANGQSSHAEGSANVSNGFASHAEGGGTEANGEQSHSEGSLTKANGDSSHAEGDSSSANGLASHAEGSLTQANGTYSHAEGSGTQANGLGSHAQGRKTIAGGIYSHAGGGTTGATFSTTATGILSFNHSNSETLNSTVYANHSAILGGTDNVVNIAAINSIVLGGIGLTGTTANTVYVPALNINSVGAGPSTVDIGVDANGNVVNVASDARLKENINTIDGALDKILSLRGVTYNWIDRENGTDATRMGFIAQEVKEIVPELVYQCSNNEYFGVHYSNTVALLVEAMKELATNGVKTTIETQIIKAEDNNIELNFNGTHESAIGGGISVLKGVDEETNSSIYTNDKGDWVFSPNISIPFYTPSSSNDPKGNIGNTCYDNDFYYVKTKMGWKRNPLNNF